MELLNKNEQWFSSEEGMKIFHSLSSLEDRAIFIYSYLKNILPSCLEKNKIIFKIAFFIADNIEMLGEEIAEYPGLISANNNPFLYYLSRLDYCPQDEILYVVFSAILHKKVDVKDGNEWIYNKALLTSDEVFSTLGEMGMDFLPQSDIQMADPDLYEDDEKNGLLQLNLVWLFLE